MTQYLRSTAALIALVVSGLQGCATVGSGDFACPGRPTGVRCASAVEVYALTEGTDTIEPTSKDALGDEPGEAEKVRQEQHNRVVKQVAEDKAKTEPVDVRETSPRTPVPEMQRDKFDGQLLQASTGGAPIVPLVHKPIPVRTPAQVMRVWVAPWEDAKGVLHIGGYHFVEIQARRWSFGGQGDVKPVRLISIQEPYPDTKSTGGESPPNVPSTVQVSTSKK